MSVITRRRFITTAGAGVGALAIDPSIARGQGRLDRDFEHPLRPRVTMSYPSTWHLHNKLVKDLVDPVEICSITSHAIEPSVSKEESGFPDLEALPVDGMAVSVYAVELLPSDRYSPGVLLLPRGVPATAEFDPVTISDGTRISSFAPDTLPSDLRVEDSVSFGDFSESEAPERRGFTRWYGWYLSPPYGYMLMAWAAKGLSDQSVMKAVIESFAPPSTA